MDSRTEVISRRIRRSTNMILQGGFLGDFKEMYKRSIWNGRRLQEVLTVAFRLA